MTAKQCVALFGRGLLSPSTNRQSSTDLENQLGRFKIWAGNIGVFAAGNASLDFRLRNDPDVREVVLRMLTRLRRTIEQFINPSIAEMLVEEEGDSDKSNSSTSSSVSLVLSVGGDSQTSSLDGVPDQRQQLASASRLQIMDSIISRLYRLSAIIRKPISFSENAKVARFIDKDHDRQDMEEYESHIRWQVQFRHPQASQILVDRLVNAVVFRRKKLLYRERHQQKLSQGIDHVFGTDLTVPSDMNALKGYDRNPNQFRGSNSALLKVAATMKSSSRTMPLSATQASSVNRQGLASYAKSFALSGMTKSAIARREELDVPPPPEPTKETAEAICPYCFEIVDKGRMAKARWTSVDPPSSQDRRY